MPSFYDILPTLSALTIGIFTLYINYRLGKMKDSSEIKNIKVTQEEAFRDDLLLLIKEYDAKIEKQDLKIMQLQKDLTAVREENYELRVTNNELKRKVTQLQDELNFFHRKVYYREDKKKDE